MPWKVVKQGEQWCVYKHDESGDPVGDTLGCHDSEEKAQAQMRALYANEPKSTTTAVSSPEIQYVIMPESDVEGTVSIPSIFDVKNIDKALKPEETLIAYGDAVKTFGEGKIGGYLVRFTDEEHLDLEGDYFDASTDYGPHKTSLVWYQHAQDGKLQKRVLDEDAELRADDVGVWIDAQLELRDAYERYIYEEATKGRMGWSSGTASHLVAREKAEKGHHISVWPLGLDASLTPTPAEPQNAVIPLKSLKFTDLVIPVEDEPASIAPVPEESGKDSASEPQKPAKTIQIIDNEEQKMAEQTKVEAKEQPSIDTVMDKITSLEQAFTKAFNQLKAVPAVDKAIDQTPEGTDHPETKDFGDWCIAVMRGDTKRLNKVYGTKAALNEASGEEGGYLVPPDYSREILRIASENAVVRPRARIIPMAGREFNMPALDYTGSTADQPPSLGGMVATWTEEAGSKTETEPTFKTVKLVYHELSGYTVASNMLRQDAGPALAAMLTSLFGETIAWYEDWAFLQGNGVGKPLGVFNANCLLSEAAGANTCVITDIANMLTKFLPMNPTSGIWVCHPTARAYLIALDDDSNIIWIPNARDSLPMTMFGMPVIFSEKMPVFPAAAAAANKGGILLADFNYYLIGSRTGIQIDFSEHFKFDTNQGTWRFVIHVDGQPWLQSAPYLADGSNQVSPFVTLSGA